VYNYIFIYVYIYLAKSVELLEFTLSQVQTLTLSLKSIFKVLMSSENSGKNVPILWKTCTNTR